MGRPSIIGVLAMCAVCGAFSAEGAEKTSDKPDPEMLRMMEFLKDWEMFKNMELLKEMQRVGGDAKGGTTTAQNSLPTKQKESGK